MQRNNGTSLRDMLSQLPTEQLDEMLHTELGKEAPDDHAVRMILDLLEERECEEPIEMDEQTAQAWEKYQARLEEGGLKPKLAKRLHLRWLLTTAAVLVLVMTFIIPQQAYAETFREMLTRWKQDILEFFDPSEKVVKKEHYFETDNDGLQQIYDAALALGIEEPLIPMWFDKYELSEIKIIETVSTNSVVAELQTNNTLAILRVDFFESEKAHGFFADDKYYESFEKEGVRYEITLNNDRWVAVWKKGNTEYSVTIDCQEDTLRRILASIYVMEE